MLFIQFSRILGLELELNKINYNWTDYIENATEMDGLSDIKNKILNHDRAEEINLADQPHSHWWRIVKFSVRLREWTLSKKLIDAHKSFDYGWISHQDYFKVSNNNLKKKIGYEAYCKQQFEYKTVYDWERILEVNEMFDRNTKLIDALNDENNKEFRKCWIQKLNALGHERDDVVILLKQWNYPTS
eukprot:106802_1